MPARTSTGRAANPAQSQQVPLARPPGSPGKPRAAAVNLPPLEPQPSFWEWEFWTPEARKGWAGSLVAHSLLLVALASWYFAPRLNGPATFDSRLAGSPNGVPEGELLTGGLNTPETMIAAPKAETELALTAKKPGDGAEFARIPRRR
jgi:hypothetical protein